MLQFPPPLRKSWIALLALQTLLSASSRAQDFTLMVTNPNPLGLGAFVPTGKELELGIDGGFKGDFSYGLAIHSAYNSNFFQSENHPESELSTFISPWLHYVSDPEGGAAVSVTVNYTPSYRCYMENPDLDGFDQSGDVTLTFLGGRTQVDVFGRYSEVSGADRLTGEFVEGSLLTAGFRATRRVAPKTRLNAGWSYGISDYGSSGNEGAEVHTAYFGGLWDVTPRTSLGPTLRYTRSESDNTGTRDAWALLMEARYRVGERLWLSASVGPEYARNSDGGRDETSYGLACELTARYIINERWTWTNSLRSATVPSPSEANYLVNNISFSTALHRSLLRGSVGFGLYCNYSEYEDVGDTTMALGDEQNASIFVNYNRPMFHDRVNFNTEARYTFNEGVTDWSQWMVSAGLSVAF